MPTVSFTCPKPYCYFNPITDIQVIKLLKTIATGNAKSNHKNVEWTIFTCPNCKTTYEVNKHHEWTKIAPRTHIAAPNIETKP